MCFKNDFNSKLDSIVLLIKFKFENIFSKEFILNKSNKCNNNQIKMKIKLNLYQPMKYLKEIIKNLKIFKLFIKIMIKIIMMLKVIKQFKCF